MAIVSGAVCIGQGSETGFCNGASLQAHTLWLYEWHCLDGVAKPSAQISRLSIESHGPPARPMVNHQRHYRRTGELDRIPYRRRYVGHDLRSKTKQGCARHVDCCRGSNSYRWNFGAWQERRRVSFGTTPAGLTLLQIPWINPTDVTTVLSGGLAVALISFADTSVLSRAYAARTRTYVDPNQELVGLGAANLAAGLFQGFPISSSSSRTPVAEAAGAKTQMTGVVGAVAVALLIIAAPNLLQNLPMSALAAVVIASAIGLFEIQDLIRIYRMQKWEFWLSMLCFAGVAVFGAIPGIAFAVIIAVIEFLWDAWRPHSAILGRADGVRAITILAAIHRLVSSPAGPLPLGCASVFRKRGTVSGTSDCGCREVADTSAMGGRGRRASNKCRRYSGRCCG